MLGPETVRQTLSAGENGSATGSLRADDIRFGPDISATGRAFGATYLGVPRGNPLAGTSRSLGKLLRAELPRLSLLLQTTTILRSSHGTGGNWQWNKITHPWIFCCFDKTLTGIWHGAKPPLPPVEPDGFHYTKLRPEVPPLLNYRWMGIVPETGPPDPRFFLAGMSMHATKSLVRHANAIRHSRNFEVANQIGFEGLDSGYNANPTGISVVLNTICLRVISAMDAQKAIQTLIKLTTQQRANAPNVDERIDADAQLRWLEDLDFCLHLWTCQMLDLAYWMQTDPVCRASKYVDSHRVHRAATFLLRPDGRRHGWSHGDMPDLTPYLSVSNAFHDREFSAKGGGGGGGGGGSGRVMVAETVLNSFPSDHHHHSNHSETTKQETSGEKKNEKISGGSSSAASPSHGPFRGSRALSVLVHVTIRKSFPQRCKGRSLKNMCQRYAIEDPPAGLALMDSVVCMLTGATPGCKVRPRFAVQARIRVQALVFRGASASDTEAWMQDNAKVMQLAFTEYYLYAVRWDLAFQAVICNVQLHTEFSRKTRESGDQIRGFLDMLMACHDPKRPGPKGRFAGIPPTRALHNVAWEGHDRGLDTFGKARKGSFVTRMSNLIKGWLRTLRTSRTVDICDQYKREVTQMLVLSKMMFCTPECAHMIVNDIMTEKAQEAATVTPETKEAKIWLQRDNETGRSNWGLGVPLRPIPDAMVESFRAWEGDNSLFTSPWFADRSFFVDPPYQWLDHDTVRALDLAAWMSSRRTDARLVLSWLRYPIGLSEMAYERLCLLYFSYEFCDIPDHSMENQLRKFLFRTRRRVITEAEYQSRMRLGDPSIKDEKTETICCTIEGSEWEARDMAELFGEAPEDYPSQGSVKYRPVARRIVEEYGTDQSRRDFAIVYSYIMRVTYYKQWSVMPLPEYVIRHQIEALRRRQSMSPWNRTDVNLLGVQGLCGCGRWTSKAVIPPAWTTTSSVTERKLVPQLVATTRPDSVTPKQQKEVVETAEVEDKMMFFLTGINRPNDEPEEELEDEAAAKITHKKKHGKTTTILLQPEHRQACLNVVPTRRQPKPRMKTGGGGGGAALAFTNCSGVAPGFMTAALSGAAAMGYAAGRGIVSNVATSKVDLKVSRTKSVYDAALSITTSSRGTVSRLDDTDIRLSVQSSRWGLKGDDTDIIDRSDLGGGHHEFTSSSSNLKQGNETTKKESQFLLEWSHALSCDEEVVSRDVHTAKASRVIGRPYMAIDMESNHSIFKEKNSGTSHPIYCRGTELFQINLIGVVVRPKGPKVAPDGPAMTICATCGIPTVYTKQRWNHRGPTCGAHGRPHRLPALLKPLLETVPPVLKNMVAAAKSDRDRFFVNVASVLMCEEIAFADSRVKTLFRVDGANISTKIHETIDLISADSGCPSPANTPLCWYCHATAEQKVRAWDYDASTTDDEINTESVFTNWNMIHSGVAAVRFKHGTSVASSCMSSTGAAILARQLVTKGTDQATAVRHINVRGSMFGVDGVNGSLVPVMCPGDPHPTQPPSSHCARNTCDCWEGLDHQASAAEEFNHITKSFRRHSSIVSAQILPVELLPAVGPEVCIRVLDDLTPLPMDSNPMAAQIHPLQQTCIYLCNVHIKDRRVGWISRHGKFEQWSARESAKNRPHKNHGDLVQWDETTMDAAILENPIGRTVMMHRMMNKVELLSEVYKEIRRGQDRRMNEYGRSHGTGLNAAPDQSRRRFNKDGMTYLVKGHKFSKRRHKSRSVKNRRSSNKTKKKQKKNPVLPPPKEQQ